MTRPQIAILLSVLAAGCTETVQLARDPLEQMVSLEITPGDATITITDLALPRHTLQYTALGRFADGSARDITSLVAWSSDNVRLGALGPGGLFTTSQAAAGRATVTAAARDLSATAALTVKIETTIVDTSFPPPAADLFDPANPVVADPTMSPALVYPSDGTMFPQSIASTLFQYQRGTGNDAFRLLFESDVLRLAVETGADRWQAAGMLQRLLAATGFSGPIRVEIQATSSTGPGTIYAGNRVTLSFTKDAPGGVLYFWSAATNGIMRGGVDVTTAGKLYPASETCVGCHAISREGTTMGMGWDNTISIDLQTIDLGSLATRIAASTSRPTGWMTFSPDATRVLVANNGILTLYDAATGASLGTVPLPPMRYATHPDWSPDGKSVAIALTQLTPNNLEVKAASIARIDYNDGAWSPPEVLVPGASTNNNYFPKWAPDGASLAFVRAAGASQGAASAELMWIPASGGTPISLYAANRRVGTGEMIGLANTMPTWSPREGDRTWLAFVSARPYGAILPTSGRGQIWVTSLDLTQPGDTSTPAFWLPCQDTTVLNNNPVWSNNIVTQ